MYSAQKTICIIKHDKLIFVQVLLLLAVHLYPNIQGNYCFGIKDLSLDGTLYGEYGIISLIGWNTLSKYGIISLIVRNTTGEYEIKLLVSGNAR